MKKKLSHLLLCMFLLLPLLGFSQQDKVLIQGDVPHLCGTSELHEKKMKEDPVYKREVEEKEERLRAYESKRSSTKSSTTAKSTSTTSALYTIPVVFHVVHTGQPLGDPKNPTNAQIQNKIADLNMIFRGTHPAYPPSTSGGVDTEIEFQLVSMSSSCAPLNGIDRIDASSDPTYAANGLQASSGGLGITEAQLLAKSPSWANTPYMHIWLVTNIPGGVAGYAYLSSNRLFSENMSDVVLTHELGHALGLYHTFEGGCTNSNCTVDGDKICDTDPHTTVIGSCTPSTPNSCTGLILGNLIYNWMNYGNCQNRFTAGQATRMQNTLNANLSYLINPQSTLAPVVPNLTVCSNNPVSFTVQNPVSGAIYGWYDSSGVLLQNSSSISYTPPVFTTAGTYNYSVQAINNGCTSSLVPFTVIVLNGITAPVVTNQTLSVGQSAVITVQNPVAGMVYNWYNSSNTLLQSSTSTSYQTSYFNTTGVFNYTVSPNAFSCVSTPTPFTLTVIAQSACPPVTPCDLVPNGDFEQYSTLPTAKSQITKSCGWLSANSATPDYFNGLSPLSTNVSVPCNYFGLETDQFNPTKKAYAGIVGSSAGNSFSEKIYTQLNQTLLPYTDYTLTFDLSLADSAQRSCKINAYLDSNTSFYKNAFTGITMSATTGLFLLSPIRVTNRNGWTTVTINFNTGSKTGLKYLVLGGISVIPTNLDLTSTATTYTSSCSLGGVGVMAYYYLDNVSLKKSDVPTVNPMVICTGNTATLTITNTQPGVIYNWYTTQTTTTPFYTGTSYTTPVLTASTSYWVEAVSASGVSCRGQAFVTVDTLITSPILNYSITCLTNIATIVVTNPTPGATYTWYSTPTSTNPLGIGTSFNTSALSAPTTYWVESSNACNSLPRVAITVNPFLQQINAANTTICFGNTATLSVSSPISGVTYNWYANQTATIPLGTLPSYTTPVLNTSTSYWVEGVNTSGAIVTCRSMVTVTVNPFIQFINPNPIICPGNTATLSVSNPQLGITYKWYTSQTSPTSIGTGTSFTTPALSTTTSYWVEGVNASGTVVSCRSQAVVTVNIPPTSPILNYWINCNTNQATIFVTNPTAGVIYNWYANQTSTTILASGTSFIAPVLSAPTTYWVGSSINACNYSRVPITVTPLVQLVVTNTTICSGNTATLSVSNPMLGVTYKWYTSSNSTTPTYTGINFTTPVLNTSTSYWVEGVNASGTVVTCRSMVTVTVIASTIPPIIIPTPIFAYFWNCATNTADIHVSPSTTGTTHSWYATQTSTTILATGNNITTPALTTPTTYWVKRSVGCDSLARVPITVTPIQANCTNISATQSGSTITATVQGSVSTGSTASYVWTLTRPNGTTVTQTTTTNSVSFNGITVAGTYNITVNVNATLNGTTCTSTCGTTLQFCTVNNGIIGFYASSIGTGSNYQVIEHFQYNGTFNPSTAPVTYTWTLIDGNGNTVATANTSSNTWDYTYPSTFCLGCLMTIQCVAQMNAPYTCSSNSTLGYTHGSPFGSGNAGGSTCAFTVAPPSISTATQGLTYQFKGNAPSVNGALCTSWDNQWYVVRINPSGSTSMIATFYTVNNAVNNYTFPAYSNYKITCYQSSGENCFGSNETMISVRSRFDTPMQRMSNSSSKEVSLSPNPTNDIVNIEVPNGDKIEEVQLFNLNGLLLDPEVTLNNNTFNLQKYPNAEYIVIIKTNVNDYNFKIIKK